MKLIELFRIKARTETQAAGLLERASSLEALAAYDAPALHDVFIYVHICSFLVWRKSYRWWLYFLNELMYCLCQRNYSSIFVFLVIHWFAQQQMKMENPSLIRLSVWNSLFIFVFPFKCMLSYTALSDSLPSHSSELSSVLLGTRCLGNMEPLSIL